jgi:hypothetical protein
MIIECKKCKKNFETTVISRKYCLDCSPKNNEQAKKSYRLQRWIVLIHYGGNPPKCSCCETNYYEFLTIDHIEGGGLKHRKSLGGKSKTINGIYNPRKFYQWLIENNFPEGYRVLCMNCNHSYGHYGYCPHNHPTQVIPKNLNLSCLPQKINNWVGTPSDKPKNKCRKYIKGGKNPIQICKNCGGEFKNEGNHPNFSGFCKKGCQEQWRLKEQKRLGIKAYGR